MKFMIKFIFKYCTIYTLSLCLITFTTLADTQDICLNSSDSSKLLAILQASEKDIKSLKKCTDLITVLESEIELRDKRIVSITNDLIKANQQILIYKKKYEDTETLLEYSAGANIVLILLTIAPFL